MKKTSGMARQCVVAVALALLQCAATIPAAHGDDGEDTAAVVIPMPPPSGETPPDQQTPSPPDDLPDEQIVETPLEGDNPPADETSLVDVPSTGDETATTPVQEQPAPPGSQPAETPGLLDGGVSPAIVPRQLQQRIPEELVADGQEAVPATDEATPTPIPSITSEASATAEPIALPEPVSKTIDAVVATASGSPIYVQLLTVVGLIGAGIAYFRVLGSKGTRVPSKSVK